MYKIIVFNQTDNKPNVLDLYDDINISLNYTINDIRNIGAFNANYSKTIIIPASKSNNIIFDGVYNINKKIFKFDKSKTLRCVIIYDDVQIASGSLLLNQINYIKNDAYQYECYFLGDIYSIFDKIGTQSVYDLNWSVNNLPEFTQVNQYFNNQYDSEWSTIDGTYSMLSRNNWIQNNSTYSVTSLLNAHTNNIDRRNEYYYNYWNISDVYLEHTLNYNTSLDLKVSTSNLFTQSNFYNNNIYPSPVIMNTGQVGDDFETFFDDKLLNGAIYPVFNWKLLYIKILKENGYKIHSSSNFDLIIDGIYNNNYKNNRNGSNGFPFTNENNNNNNQYLLLKNDYSDLDGIKGDILPVVSYKQDYDFNIPIINDKRDLYSNVTPLYTVVNSYTYSSLIPVMYFNQYLNDNNYVNILSYSASSNSLIEYYHTSQSATFINGVTSSTFNYNNIASNAKGSNRWIWNDKKNSYNGAIPIFSTDWHDCKVNSTTGNIKTSNSGLGDEQFDKYTFKVSHHTDQRTRFIYFDNIKYSVNSNPIGYLKNGGNTDYIFYGINQYLRGGAFTNENKGQVIRTYRNDNIVYWNKYDRVGIYTNNNKHSNRNSAKVLKEYFNDDSIYNYQYLNNPKAQVYNVSNDDFKFGKYVVEHTNKYQFELGLFTRLEFRNYKHTYGTTVSNAGESFIYSSNTFTYSTVNGDIVSNTTYNYFPDTINKDISGTYSYNLGIYVEKNKDNYDNVSFNNNYKWIQQIGTLSYSFNLNEFYTTNKNTTTSSFYDSTGALQVYYKDDSTNPYKNIIDVALNDKIYMTSSQVFNGMSRYTTDPKYNHILSDEVWLEKGDKVFVQCLQYPLDNYNPQGLKYGFFHNNSNINSIDVNIEIDKNYDVNMPFNLNPDYDNFGDSFSIIIDDYNNNYNYLDLNQISKYSFLDKKNPDSNLDFIITTGSYYGRSYDSIYTSSNDTGNFFTNYMVADNSLINVSVDQQYHLDLDLKIEALTGSSFFNYTASNALTYSVDKIEMYGLYFLDFKDVNPNNIINNEPKVLDFFPIGVNSNTLNKTIQKTYNLEAGYNRYGLFVYNGLTASTLTSPSPIVKQKANANFDIYAVKDTDFVRKNDRIFINPKFQQADIIKDMNKLYNILIIPDSTDSKLLRIYSDKNIMGDTNEYSDKVDLDSDYKIQTNSDILNGYKINFANYNDKQFSFNIGSKVSNEYQVKIFSDFVNTTEEINSVALFIRRSEYNDITDNINNHPKSNINCQNIIISNMNGIILNNNINNISYSKNIYTDNSPVSASTYMLPRYTFTDDFSKVIYIHQTNYNRIKDGFILTCYIKLDLLLINKIQLQDYIILNLDGNKSKWTINKIIDYTPTNSLTKVELIKNNN